MRILYRTRVVEVGPEVPDLLEGGVLVLFRTGAPRDLADIAILHEPETQEQTAPRPGDALTIGERRLTISAVGERAWAKAIDIGHVTFTFSGASAAERPGEICVSPCPAEDILEVLKPGTIIEVGAGDD